LRGSFHKTGCGEKRRETRRAAGIVTAHTAWRVSFAKKSFFTLDKKAYKHIYYIQMFYAQNKLSRSIVHEKTICFGSRLGT
jgi:hypothetical protein